MDFLGDDDSDEDNSLEDLNNENNKENKIKIKYFNEIIQNSFKFIINLREHSLKYEILIITKNNSEQVIFSLSPFLSFTFPHSLSLTLFV